jgi:N6-adenosine-specific RNA methylase IME4
VIYADPPWEYDFAQSESRAIENQYPPMALEEICRLPVPDIAADNAVLFLWATTAKLAESFQVVAAWGFTYVTSMCWVKDKIGMGYYVRNQHELLLIAKRGEPAMPAESVRPSSVIHAPRTKHSAKPPEFAAAIEAMYPDWPKVELFSRSPRDGWVAWGNQADAT